eukprot:SAG11_NODE_19734_length_460_cov_0.570637_2_plen_71_part_01
MTVEQHRRKRLDMWRAMEAIYARGEARAIGVSNFTRTHLEALLPNCVVRPMVNQIGKSVRRNDPKPSHVNC